MSNTNPKWPYEKEFVLCLTHDVDRVKKEYQYFTRFSRFLKRLQMKNAFEEVFSFLKFYFSNNPINDPYWNFEQIMEIERKYDVRSTFFFLNESGKINIFEPETWKLYLGRYNIKDSKIIKMIKKMDLEGWEIGLHGSYKSYKDINLLKKEKEELEKNSGKQIYGVRQHYLNLEVPRTWKLQDEIGFEYDASFRIGDCIENANKLYFPFHPLNSAFLEIPLAIMDTALFSGDKNIEEIWNIVKKIVEAVEKQNGVLVVLWHQRVFNEKEFPNQSNIYEELIKLCKEKNAWITNAGEIKQWWDSQ